MTDPRTAMGWRVQRGKTSFAPSSFANLPLAFHDVPGQSYLAGVSSRHAHTTEFSTIGKMFLDLCVKCQSSPTPKKKKLSDVERIVSLLISQYVETL